MPKEIFRDELGLPALAKSGCDDEDAQLIGSCGLSLQFCERAGLGCRGLGGSQKVRSERDSEGFLQVMEQIDCLE